MDTNIVSENTLHKFSERIASYYRNAGYRGNWGNEVEFVRNGNKLVLTGPEYTQFMLNGRQPGKMPPIQPIKDWCKRYGINANPWAIRYNIGINGTKGNNFIEKNEGDFVSYVAENIAQDIDETLSKIIQK